MGGEVGRVRLDQLVFGRVGFDRVGVGRLGLGRWSGGV